MTLPYEEGYIKIVAEQCECKSYQKGSAWDYLAVRWNLETGKQIGEETLQLSKEDVQNCLLRNKEDVQRSDMGH